MVSGNSWVPVAGWKIHNISYSISETFSRQSLFGASFISIHCCKISLGSEFFFFSAWFSPSPLWLGKESKRKTCELSVSQERSYFINWTWTDESGAWGKLFLLWILFQPFFSFFLFFSPRWSLCCKRWGLLFQLNLVGAKIICKPRMLSYSSSRVIQAGKSFPSLSGSAD